MKRSTYVLLPRDWRENPDEVFTRDQQPRGYKIPRTGNLTGYTCGFLFTPRLFFLTGRNASLKITLYRFGIETVYKLQLKRKYFVLGVDSK